MMAEIVPSGTEGEPLYLWRLHTPSSEHNAEYLDIIPFGLISAGNEIIVSK